MTKIINFFGGPSAGKSTCSTNAFSALKDLGMNAEYVPEYVKQWAWEQRKPVDFDQFYFFGRQSRKEYSLFNQVDVILTDSPVALSAYYAHLFGTNGQKECFELMTKTYYNMCKEKGITHYNIWLNRVKPYNPKGRFQTEDEAKAIDIEMKQFLIDLGINMIDCNGTRADTEALVKHLIMPLVFK